MTSDAAPRFYEFFAGGGMARSGLGPRWTCLLANDVDPAKARSYAENFGAGAFRLADVANLSAADLPGRADLLWASFPCQDLSLAGAREGLAGGRSGLFFAIHRLMAGLRREGRAPIVAAFENVTGLLTSRGGGDFAAMVEALVGLGYRVGALVIDAERFHAQSRPRVFMVAIDAGWPVPAGLSAAAPTAWTTPKALERAVAGLPVALGSSVVWWRLPAPPVRNHALADLIETGVGAPGFRPQADTERLLDLMAAAHRAEVEALRRSGARAFGTVFRRTRVVDGVKRQRAEVRFDGLAGCLRTPAGGSSRQTLLAIEDGHVRSRLLSARECARLMGLDEGYRLPRSLNPALHLIGDGVAVGVVRHLEAHLFGPALSPARAAAA